MLTRDEINKLEENLQEGFLCTVHSSEAHTAENADPSVEPILHDSKTQLLIYQALSNQDAAQKNLFIEKIIPRCFIPLGEAGEITDFNRLEQDKAEIKIKWRNGMYCNYIFSTDKLPFHLKYEPEENPAQLRFAV